jgi:hypothetical protein
MCAFDRRKRTEEVMARKSRFAACAAAITVLIAASSCGVVGQQSGAFQEDFNLAQCALSPTGRNDYFILEHFHVLSR